MLKAGVKTDSLCDSRMLLLMLAAAYESVAELRAMGLRPIGALVSFNVVLVLSYFLGIERCLNEQRQWQIDMEESSISSTRIR